MSDARGLFRWLRFALALAIVSVVVAEVAIFSAPATHHLESLAVSVHASASPSGSSVDLEVTHGSADRRLRLVAFPLQTQVDERTIYVYQDPTYPTASSDPNLGALENLAGQLYIRHYLGQIIGVDAKGLKEVLLATSLAPRRIVVTMSGVLPADVFSKRANLLSPWTAAGGLVLSGGATLGYYSGLSGRNLTDSASISYGERGPEILLGKGVATFPWVYERPANVPSDFASALNIKYKFASAGLQIGPVLARGGFVLGWTTSEYTSLAYIPSNRGGYVVFGGEVVDPQELSYDVSQILGSGALAAESPPHVASRELDLRSMASDSIVHWQLSFQPPRSGIEIFAYDPDPEAAFSYRTTVLAS